MKREVRSQRSEVRSLRIPQQSCFPGRGPSDLHLASRFLLLASLLSLSCNQPFNPVVNYAPQLAVYSILFSNKQGVYVRLYSTIGSISGSVNIPVHDAELELIAPNSLYDSTDSTGRAAGDTFQLKESDSVTVASDTDFYYYNPMTILSGRVYEIVAQKSGYKSVSAYVSVPASFVTIPDTRSYSALRYPDSINYDPYFAINLGGSVAYFAQIFVEYRGFDSTGNFHSGFVNASGNMPQNPFIQSTASQVQYSIDRLAYASTLSSVRRLASGLKDAHLYANIVVTQLDDPLYRFYLTSGRWTNPLAMRTDRPIFSDVNNGLGIVAAAAVDTTRIFLF